MSAPSRAGHQRGGAQRGMLKFEGRVWRLRYRAPPDASGKRRLKSIMLGDAAELPTFAAARVAGDRAIERLSPRRLAPGASLTWCAWCERFKNLYVSLLRPSSRATVTSVIDNHLQPAFATLHLHEIETRQVQEWVSAMVKAGAAPATVRQRHAILRRMLRRAEADGLAARAPPARSIEFGKAIAVQASVAEKAFTAAEMTAIIETSERPWRTIYALGAFAGLRAGEILGLEHQHVDLENRRLQIRQSAVMGRIQLTKSKRSEADLYISDPLAEELRAYLATARPNARGLLFAGPKGGPLWSSGVRARHLTPLLKRLGIRERSMHAFRHGCAFAMFRAGASATAVRDALRHSSLVVTERYAGSTAPDRRAAFELLASSFLSLKSPKVR
ncbi:MAG: tyrosine-type recombinase/integrase [Steroidobacteraceae bacterium]